MSGLEKEEVLHRTKGMSDEEQRLTARLLPDELLWEELQRRYSTQNAMLKRIKGIMIGEKE